MPRKHVEFPKFVDGLHAAGVDVPAVKFLSAPQESWREVPREVRSLVLEALELGGVDPDDVIVSLRKKAGEAKRLKHVYVVIHAKKPGTVPARAWDRETPLDLTDFHASDAPRDELLALPEGPDATPAAEDDDAIPQDVLAAAAEAGDPEQDADRAQAEWDAAVEDADEGAVDALEAPADADAVTALAEPASEASLPDEADAPDDEAQGDAAEDPEAEEAPAEAEAEAPKRKGFGRLLGRRKKADADAPAEEDASQGGHAVVTEMPPITDPNVEVLEIYPVQEPYAFIRILHDNEAQEHLYEVIEPTLSDRERNVLEFIQDTLVDVIEVGAADIGPSEAAGMLRKHVDEIIYDYSVVLSPVSKEKILYYILRDFLGFGLLDPIMRDEMIEDVSCDGPKVPIFLYHRKYESLKSRTMFMSDDEADSFVIRMAQRSGKHISIAEPLLDATLPDGSRLNATLSDEVTANGSTFTIRKFKEDPFTAPDLVRFGTMNADILAYWWLAVQNGASAIYAGGTASGKTTSLNAILLFIPPQMKIVSIEDTREINLPHLNWIPGVTRSGFGPRDNHGRQAGEIDMFTLLKAALRQRPEFILVGEVRGAEAYALFQAMATGHTAYGTMHADSVEAVIHRLESEPISIPRSLLEALDIVSIQIQTRIGDKRVRRTKEIVEVVGLDPHTREILTNEVFTWDPSSDTFEYSGVSYVLERIMMERNMDESTMREEFARRKEVIELMIALELRDYRQVAKVIVGYYKDPAKTLARLRDMKAQRDAEAAPAEDEAPVEDALDDAPEPEAEAEDDWPEPEPQPQEVPWANTVPWEEEETADGGTRWRVIQGLPGADGKPEADADADAVAAPSEDELPPGDALANALPAPAEDAPPRGLTIVPPQDAPDEQPARSRIDLSDLADLSRLGDATEDAGTDEDGAPDEDAFERPPGLAVPVEPEGEDAPADAENAPGSDEAEAAATAAWNARGRRPRDDEEDDEE